ncbi:hypothetical protein KKA33_03370 [Patescibacteria group bacterium]|nr:hypothetical protein [Patescibacteria group bacterium]
MKELFNKLSNLFNFGKESRLANVDEALDMPEPDDSKIDPMEVPFGQKAPDMSGSTEEPSPWEEMKKGGQLTAKAKVGLKKMEKLKMRELSEEEKRILDFEEKPEPKKPEFTNEEKQILDFEEKGASKALDAKKARASDVTPTAAEPDKSPLPARAEYAKIERDEAAKGKEVSREISKKYYNYLRSALKDFNPKDLKIANDILFGRAYQQNEMGTSPEDTMKYVKVLQEGDELNSLVKKVIELHAAGDQEEIEAFESQIDQRVRDRTRSQEAAEKLGTDYLAIEKGAIKNEIDNLIADFPAQAAGKEAVYVAEAGEEKPVQVSDAFVKEWTGGFESDEEWGPEKTPKKTPAEEAEELRQEILAKKTRIAGESTRKPRP